jgi:hypothetical protein
MRRSIANLIIGVLLVLLIGFWFGMMLLGAWVDVFY